MPIGLPSPVPTAIIHCPDCGVECNYVANCHAEMPFSYPGNYHPHQKGSRGCLERQVRNLKKRIKHLTEEVTGKKYLIHLWFSGPRGRHAVVIDHTPRDAIIRAQLHEPDGEWAQASVEIITRVRASRISRVLAMERRGFSPSVLKEIYHAAGWTAIVHVVAKRQPTKTELADLQRLRSALERGDMLR